MNETRLITKAATPGVNSLADGLISTVADTAVVDVRDMKNVSVMVNQVGDFATLDLGGHLTHFNTVVRSRHSGDTPHVIVQAGAGSGAGTITDISGVTTITFDSTVSTVTQMEALIATSTLIAVLTPGTGANVLTAVGSADVLSSTPLVLGTSTFSIALEKSSDGSNWVPLATVTHTQVGAGANVASETTLSDSNGMPLMTKMVRATLSSMTGVNAFSLSAAGSFAGHST